VTNTIWAIIFGVGVAQGVFLIALTLALPFANRRAAHLLAALVAVLTFMIGNELLELFVGGAATVWLIPVGINMDLLLGPLVWLLVRAIHDPGTPTAARTWVHFIPFLIGVALWTFLIATRGHAAMSGPDGISPLVAIFVAIKAVIVLSYLIGVDRIFAQGAQVAGAARTQRSFGLLRTGVRGFVVLVALIYLNFFLFYFGVPSVPDSDHVGSLLLALSIYSFTIVVIRHPRLLGTRPVPESNPEWTARIRARFEDHKCHLDPELSLGDLARDLGLSDNQLSEILNGELGESFADLLARYRLAEFEALCRADPEGRRSVLELALDAGFNSKASFYRVFQAVHQITPSAYREQVGQKISPS